MPNINSFKAVIPEKKILKICQNIHCFAH